MNELDRYLLNKVNLFMAECYEANSIMPPAIISEMFGKIFKNDISYIKLAPDGLEGSVQELVSDINKYCSDTFKSSLKVFIVCYYDTINYEKVLNMQMNNADRDRYWYKALIADYMINSLLIDGYDSKLTQFKAEYADLGTLIGRYYNESDKNKSLVIRNMIGAKLNEIYSRYNYKFNFPSLLCS